MKRTSLLLFFFTVLVGVVNLIVFVSITEQPKVAEAAFESYKVTPIILVPSDKVTRSEYPTAVNQSMANVRDWYVGQSGLSFNFDNVTTLNSTRPTSYFGCNEDLPYCIKTGSTGIDINLVLADIDSLIGPRRNNLDRVIFMIGAGPVAVGTVGSLANTYNYAFFGESTLDALSGRLAPEEINRARGSLAHELGHNFGLSHPDSNIPEWENVMGIGWLSYPKVIINNTILAPEMNYLKKSPFLAKQAIPSCTPFKGGHLSITTNTILCPGVYTATGSSGGVISIDANNVTLDASNATFWGDNTNSPNYGLTITGRTNVTVTNLRMSGYFYAVKVENSSNVNIINSIFNKNRQTDGNFLNINIGFPGEGGGIVFRNVTDSSVVNNVLDFQNTGIHLYGSNQNLIEGNSASFNKTWGVALNSSDSNNVLHNDTRHVNRCTDGGCDSAGILLVQGSDDNTIEGNNMNYSGDGFFLGNGTAPLRTSDRNIVRNNLGNYSPNNGFEATFSTLNVFEDNEANFNNYGFWLGYSHNNSVNNNIISSNKTNGIEIEQGRDNQITNNLFKLNGVGAYFRNSGQINSTWPGSEVSNNYNINNNSFVANTTGLHLNNVQDSFVQNNNFSANGENIRYSDKTKATLRVATSNNNITCFSAGGGASNLILNKPSTSNVPGGGGGTSPAGANDGDSTDPTKTFYFGQVHVGDWWRVDMGSSQTINALVVYSWATNYNDIPHKFHLETSTTGNFSGEQLTVATELGWDLGNPSRPRYRIYTFPNVVARYIRFVSDIDQLWTHLQEIEAYNDPNITNTYSPDVACNYNFYNNLATSVTTNLSDNYWEFAPKSSLAVSIFDNADDSTNGFTTINTQLSNKATVFGDSLRPSLSINQPANLVNLSGDTIITVSALDANGIRQVSYFVDGIFIGRNYFSPYSLSLDTRKLANGSHTLLAIATDLANNVESVSRTFSTSNTITIDTVSPTKPTNLVANLPSGSSTVTLSWTPSTDNSGGPISYLIKRNAAFVAIVTNPSFSETLGNTSDVYSVVAIDSSENYSLEEGPVLITTTGPPKKEGDFNNDGFVNSTDLAILISTWGSRTDLRADANNDGVVSSPDLARLISKWGS